MAAQTTAAVWSDTQTAMVRDDPSGRMVLAQRSYRGP